MKITYNMTWEEIMREVRYDGTNEQREFCDIVDGENSKLKARVLKYKDGNQNLVQEIETLKDGNSGAKITYDMTWDEIMREVSSDGDDEQRKFCNIIDSNVERFEEENSGFEEQGKIFEEEISELKDEIKTLKSEISDWDSDYDKQYQEVEDLKKQVFELDFMKLFPKCQ